MHCNVSVSDHISIDRTLLEEDSNVTLSPSLPLVSLFDPQAIKDRSNLVLLATLLAAAGNCDQQNSGDAMVSLAKTLNNNAQMISLAQIFVQQPRNSVSHLVMF